MATEIVPEPPPGPQPHANELTARHTESSRRLHIVRHLTIEETVGSTTTETASVVQGVVPRDPGATGQVQPVKPRPVDGTERMWSLVMAWWWSLVMAPVAAVLYVMDILQPGIGNLVVVGASCVGIGASIVVLSLIDDTVQLLRANSADRPTITCTHCPPVGRAEDGRQGRPQAARSGMVIQDHPTTPTTTGPATPQADRPSARPLVPRKSHANPGTPHHGWEVVSGGDDS